MARVWVKGYTKSDGTKVEGHYRESAISTKALTGAGFKDLRGAMKRAKTTKTKSSLKKRMGKQKVYFNALKAMRT